MLIRAVQIILSVIGIIANEIPQAVPLHLVL